MFTRGHAKHPCTQHVYSQGFAVRPIHVYPCGRIHTDGNPFYTESFKPQLCLDDEQNHQFVYY